MKEVLKSRQRFDQPTTASVKVWRTRSPASVVVTKVHQDRASDGKELAQRLKQGAVVQCLSPQGGPHPAEDHGKEVTWPGPISQPGA